MYPDLPDYLRPGLRIVFVGFNPGERSAAIGHYYAGRGNQFWNFLYESGLIPVRLGPEEDYRMLEFGFGMTDLVKRWSKSSSELNAEDYRSGVPRLKAKLLAAAPCTVAFNGKTAFERFQGSKAELGPQPHRLGNSGIFVLPSTSGRNGSLSRSQKLQYFCRLARWAPPNAEERPPHQPKEGAAAHRRKQ
ncbi:MAG TPA: mismatch-specific DNA-glycosylase [Terriglobia bacterium]|nr:mismatch-specific DNA-glycosylase [Terriglobia bacterium]